MARFDTSGVDDVIQSMIRMGEGTGKLADDMLMAAADEVEKAWQTSATRHNLKDTGDMITAIGYAQKPKTVGGVKTIDIYPQGKDRKGVRNAEKAFILHYGTEGTTSRRAKKRLRKKYKGPGIPATHWVDDADALAGPAVEAAMRKKFDEYIKTKG